jgi:hypothetical protein
MRPMMKLKSQLEQVERLDVLVDVLVDQDSALRFEGYQVLTRHP